MTEIIDNTTAKPEFSSTDIELFSVLYAITRKEPTVSRDATTDYGCFTTRCTDQVQEIINSYSSGRLMINARDLLMARRKLFRAVKALPGRGRVAHEQ